MEVRDTDRIAAILKEHTRPLTGREPNNSTILQIEPYDFAVSLANYMTRDAACRCSDLAISHRGHYCKPFDRARFLAACGEGFDDEEEQS